MTVELIRENTAGRVDHPETVVIAGKPRRVWKAPEVQEIMDLIHNGDPITGWEGDDRYALYRTEDGRWELDRLEADGEYRLTVRSRPGVTLDRSLIHFLIAHDTRRNDVLANMLKHNAAIDRELERRADERMEGVNDKLAWALRKDLGHLEGGNRGPQSFASTKDSPFWRAQ